MAFDPYHKWLGIPPDQQPASHYRLLAIEEFESDADVIETAAEQRTLLLRTFQTGPDAELAERLLNEVAAARVCLLRPASKAEYDDSLRNAVAEAEPPPAIAELLAPPAVFPAEYELPKPTVTPERHYRKNTRPNSLLVPIVVGGVLLIPLVVVMWWFIGRGGTDEVVQNKTPPASLKKGLIAYYPFNGNAQDESGNEHDGTLINGGSFTADRNLAKEAAFSFLDGANHSIKFDGLEPYAPTTTQGMSVSFWATRNAATTVLSQYPGSVGKCVFFINLEPGDNNGYDWNIAGNGIGQFRGAPQHYSNNLWQHWFVQIFPGDKGVKVYVNGKAEKSGQFALNSNTQSTPVYLGHLNGNPGKDSKGSVDDIRIYNRALSAEEVKALYEFEKP